MSTITTNNLTDLATGDSVPAKYLVRGSAKAFAVLNMATATLRDSLNITSIVDGGVGDFTANHTTAMASANYGVTGGGADRISQVLVNSASVHRQISENSSFARTDTTYFTTSVLGDLA